MTKSPDRLTFSIPPDSDLDPKAIEEAVEEGEYSSRSELVRDALRDVIDPDE